MVSNIALKLLRQLHHNMIVVMELSQLKDKLLVQIPLLHMIVEMGSSHKKEKTFALVHKHHIIVVMVLFLKLDNQDAHNLHLSSQPLLQQQLAFQL